MAITRARKEELVQQYVGYLQGADGLLVAEYRAMSVAETEDLRKKVRDSDGVYAVTKNTLLRIALQEMGWPVQEDLLTGMVGIAFSKGNLPGMTKNILDYAKDKEGKFTVKGGIMGSDVFNAKGAEAVSQLPTLPELQSQILGLLVQPASLLAGILNSANSQVVNVLQSHITENLGGGENAA